MPNNEEKSSRAAADYFELLIAQALADHFHTGDSFQDKLAEIKQKVFSQTGGPQKIIDQIMRAALSIEQTVAVLEKYAVSNGSVKSIKWVGRALSQNESKEDILVTYANGWRLGLSVKSVSSGQGTLDNAGKDMSKDFFGFDVDPEMEVLKKTLYEKITELKLGEKAEKAGFSHFHSLKYQFPELVTIGRELGLRIQKKATMSSVAGFNQLAETKKKELVSKMLGINSQLKMIFLLASGKKITVKEDTDFLTKIQGNLSAVAKTNKKFLICSDGQPLIGVQSSFTNGTGLSAFCQRAFINWK